MDDDKSTTKKLWFIKFDSLKISIKLFRSHIVGYWKKESLFYPIYTHIPVK